MRHVHTRTFLPLLTCVGLLSAILVGQQERAIEVKIVKIPYDTQKLLVPSSLSEDAMQGRNVWLQRCAFCHDGTGTPTYNTLGPWIDSDIVAKRGDAAVREKILKGSAAMPGFQHGLSAAQVNLVITFLKTVSPNDKPTPEQRAGKAKLPGDL